MVTFLIMETDCKASNKYEYVEAAKPVYLKKLLRASRSLEEKDDEVDEVDDDGSSTDGPETDGTGTGRQFCCCPSCVSSCSCCCA